MTTRRQFSLAYLFLEIFWIALTLGLARIAYWLWYRYRSDYDSWYSANEEVQFDLLVVAAVICAGIAIGGVFQRMRWGAFITIATLIGMSIIALIITPSIH